MKNWKVDIDESVNFYKAECNLECRKLARKLECYKYENASPNTQLMLGKEEREECFEFYKYHLMENNLTDIIAEFEEELENVKGLPTKKEVENLLREIKSL